MAFENIARGEKEFKQITFGTGDISISTAHEVEDDYLSMVVLSQHVAKPVSEWSVKLSHKTADDFNEKETVFLKFGRVKSIEMLIESLQEVRESMLSNKEGE